MQNSKLGVVSIQRMSLQDGHGLRTTVFLKGCYLNCPWCCNPESISTNNEYFYNEERCLLKKNINSEYCNNCILKTGEIAKEKCIFGTYISTSNKISIQLIENIIINDKQLYKLSGGGVTFSGGEPFMHAKALKPILKKLKMENIHITFETSCYFPNYLLKEIYQFIDEVFIDLKFQYGFYINHEFEIDKNNFDKNLTFMQQCSQIEIKYRMVYIGEAFDNKEKIEIMIQKLKSYNINSIELLKYHGLAKNKYKQLNKTFHAFKQPTDKQIQTMNFELDKNNINHNLLSI